MPRTILPAQGFARRELLRAGALGVAGLTMSDWRRLASAAPAAGGGQAQRCIVLFLMGGPPQHSTWDPKPAAPDNVRGAFGPIDTDVPGVQFCELLPRTAQLASKLAVLRAVSTGDNAHSSSGYYMMTGQPHAPMNFENANPGAPNDWPTLGGLVQRLKPGRQALPTAIRLPHRIFNTDGSVWPGQDAGFLGPAADPWLLNCQPASPEFRVPEFSLPAEMPLERLTARHHLLGRLDALAHAAAGGDYDAATARAFDVLTSPEAQAALALDRESAATRERYGGNHFGQSVLLARRLIEAGVTLVQVNWHRGPEEPPDNPCWDSHTDENQRLRETLAPPFDQAFSALLVDLVERGLFDSTLVVAMSEFGRTPTFNDRGGRDHWGRVFSIALAGGGMQGGVVHGASDRLGAEPKSGLVEPPDLLATILHCLGIDPKSELHDRQGRPFAAARGQVIREILA